MNYQDLLGTNLPIIQAPMAGVQDGALTIAVSSVGGLGSLPCAMLNADALRTALTAIQAQTTNPYNVNFFCHTPPELDAQREVQWRAVLKPYFDEYGISTDDIVAGPSRRPFNDEMADVLAAFKPRVVSFHFGLPSGDLLARVKSWGATVLGSATTLEEARWLEEHGADAVIAQGLEAGGHRGMFLTDDLTTQMGTFALVAQIIQVVNLPVIAAGGIADAKGVAAALALGATAVQIGTAYLLCTEVTTRPIHRTALKSDRAHHTAMTNLFSGGYARGILNRVMHEIGPISTQTPAFPLAGPAITALRQAAEQQGSGDFSPLWSGQNASGCREISASELTLLLASEL
ncbi:MAG: nitronate monooxygenase [Chloroflexota bacterium]